MDKADNSIAAGAFRPSKGAVALGGDGGSAPAGKIFPRMNSGKSGAAPLAALEAEPRSGRQPRLGAALGNKRAQKLFPHSKL